MKIPLLWLQLGRKALSSQVQGPRSSTDRCNGGSADGTNQLLFGALKYPLMGTRVGFGSAVCWLRQLVEVQGYESHSEAAEEDDQVLTGDGHNPEGKFVTERNEFL